MKILALELSGEPGSVALVEGQQELGSVSFEQGGRGEAKVIDCVEEVLADARLRVSDLDVVAAGRGPGSYTGTRIAVTVAEFLALPLGLNTYYVSSAAALSLAASEAGNDRITVVGDARRRTAWVGTFACGLPQGPELVGGWSLVPLDELVGNLPQDAAIISPDAPRLLEQLPALRQLKVRHCVPHACWVARLAAMRIAAGLPGEEREPLYLHPPVSVRKVPTQ